MEKGKEAAKRLLGVKLNDGWEVVDAIQRTGTQTGGFFSHGYLAKREDGTEAFLKAMDFSEADGAPDFARAIEQIAGQFNFERDLLEYCKDRRMRNVVRSIGGGVVDVVGDGNPLNRVQYFLFEPADGDIRKVMSSFNEITLTWCLSVLHETAIGLRQLHDSLVAHQDVKPSNILAFSGDTKIKIGDLGCASIRGTACPRDALTIPGQKTYAPPEQIYDYIHPDWTTRRVGSDMYQLGGMCVFLFVGTSINTLLADRIDPAYRLGVWKGSYAEALPHIKLAYAKIIDDLTQQMTGPLEPIVPIIRELCEPELEQRGDPSRLRKGGRQFTLEPYVSKLGNLRRKAEYASKRVVR